MRRTPGLWIIIIGVICAAVAGVLASTAIASARGMVSVVVAAKDIPPYTQITQDDLAIKQLPQDAISSDMASQISQVSGRISKSLIPKDTPIRAAMVTTKDDSSISGVVTDMSAASATPLQAFALPSSSPILSVIHPGDRISLIANTNGQAITIADSIPVLRVASGDAQNGGSLLLALTPQQVQKLVPLMGNVQISLLPYNATPQQQLQTLPQAPPPAAPPAGAVQPQQQQVQPQQPKPVPQQSAPAKGSK